MSKKSDKRRALALEQDGLAFKREIPQEAIEVEQFGKVKCNSAVTVVGRLVLTDRSGKISKLGIYCHSEGRDLLMMERLDGNGHSIPMFLTRTPSNLEAINSVIHYGDIILVEGEKTAIDGNEVLLGSKVQLLSKATGDIYDCNIDFRKRSNLYTHRHLQCIQNPEKIVHFRKCSLILRVIRQVLYQNGYDELSLTMLQESFEAGLADPFKTYAVDNGQHMFLRLTTELFLRKLMVAGFSKVFEIGKSFRNQGATGSMLPQFTILEMYKAYAKDGELEELLQNIICQILNELYESFVIKTSNGLIDCSGVWKTYDFVEEVKELTGSTYDENNPLEELICLLDKAGVVRPAVVNKYTIASSLYSHVVSKIQGPAFLKNLPAAQSPLFKVDEEKSTVDETLLVINGMLIADIVNPERDPRILRKKLEEQLTYRKAGQETGGVNEDILSAMKFALPPCRGIGMGLERLMMLLLNTPEIRDIELFPVF